MITSSLARKMPKLGHTKISGFTVQYANCQIHVKAYDLYRGSMQSEDHRRTALQYPPPLFIRPYAAANYTALLA